VKNKLLDDVLDLLFGDGDFIVEGIDGAARLDSFEES
jgi:hypothetical protein